MSAPIAKHPSIKKVNRDNVINIIRENNSYNERFGFLHIPKTGGSGVIDFFAKKKISLHKMPIPLFHDWNLRLIRSYFPEMKVYFLIRDPLERTISGFQSRLRMGQPKYFVPWRNNEAVSFSIYRSVNEFLDGLLENNDFHISATTFLLKSVMAIQWNYEYYFESPNFIKKNKESLGDIYTLKDIKSWLHLLLDKGVLKTNEKPSNIISEYSASHISSIPSVNFLSQYSKTELKNLRGRFTKEYEIYSTLQSINKKYK